MHDNALMGKFDNKAVIINMGKCVDVFAPGYKILSSDIYPLQCCNNDGEGFIAGMMHDNTCRKSRIGTSHSAALVTGAIGLLLEKCPKLTDPQNVLRYSLSINKVQLCEAMQYAVTTNKCTNLQDSVLATIISTSNHLLYIGSGLESITDCIFDSFSHDH